MSDESAEKLTPILKRGLEAAGRIDAESLPGEWKPILSAVLQIPELLERLARQQRDLERAESARDDTIDHLRVVEVAMQSIHESGDASMRVVMQAHQAATGVRGDAPARTLVPAIRRLHEALDRCRATLEESRRALLALPEAEATEPTGRTRLLEEIQATLDEIGELEPRAPEPGAGAAPENPQGDGD